MKRMCRPAFRYFFRKYGTRQKLSLEIDKSIAEKVETEEIKPKNHPGIFCKKSIDIPEEILCAIGTIAKGHPWAALSSESVKLCQYLHSRHLPAEEEQIRNVYNIACSVVENKRGATDLPEEEKALFRSKFGREIKRVMQNKLYTWKPIPYDEYRSKLYLIGRGPPEYAILHRIFQEMKQRLPDFRPETLFDFGSGVGTVTWAANTFWNHSLKEYFMVDSSADMNNLAESILNEINKKETARKGIFFRQFLPASHSLKYHLVVSAFSLMELPNIKTRLETVLTLWKKTQGYLVLVEQGTNAGFQALNEARDFLLEFCNDPKISAAEHFASIFAPCPHNKTCPRFVQDSTPCNFEVSYRVYHPVQHTIKTERFSYIIIKKGIPDTDNQWPRIVRPVLKRKGHVVCRMCTTSGKLEEVIFTASKHGKLGYKCARYSNWGDLYPGKLTFEPQPEDEPRPEDEPQPEDEPNPRSQEGS